MTPEQFTLAIVGGLAGAEIWYRLRVVYHTIFGPKPLPKQRKPRKPRAPKVPQVDQPDLLDGAA